MPRKVLLAVLCATACSAGVRRFPDRPVAWQEHDDTGLTHRPERTQVERKKWANGLEEGLVRPIDRRLRMATVGPADDVNALDEVPCSTWFCPRSLTPDEVAAGPAGSGAPELPFRIVGGKSGGAAVGYVVEDMGGRKYLLKFDPAGHLGLNTGAEIVSQRLLHAMGYHVPGSWIVDLGEGDLGVKPGVVVKLHDVDSRTLDDVAVAAATRPMAHTRDGKLRAVAIEFLPGELLGGFRFHGRRDGDPNDRIPHERRRSLRGSRVIFGWLAYFDAGPQNTMDSYVTEGGRRFVRHYLVDFGSTLGAATVRPKDPETASEYRWPFARTIRALLSLGLYHRSWQTIRPEWEAAVRAHPAVGWFPGKEWDPKTFRTEYPLEAHLDMTDRDAYWAAKVVGSLDDQQIAAAVSAAGYDGTSADVVVRTLEARRDLLTRHWLRRVTAAEEPWVNGQGTLLCFRDLALERGAARPSELVYHWQVGAAAAEARPEGPRSCLPIGAPGTARYRIVAVRSVVAGRKALREQIHLAYRAAERHWVVVGVERDD